MIELPATPRLRLRRVRLEDVDRFCALDSDDGVMRYLDWAPPTRAQQQDEIGACLRQYDEWPDHGRFVAESPAGEFVGWFGLHVHDDVRHLSLGYRLHRRFWGGGLATEGGRALIDHAFARLGAEVVGADTMSVNLPSRRVMEKCGLRYVRTYYVHFDDPLPGTEHGEVRYEITRAERLAQRRP